MKAGTTVRSVLDDKTWEAKADADDTGVSLSLLFLDPRVTVHSGAAEVGATEGPKRRLTANRYVESSKPKTVKTLPKSQQGQYSWVNSWYASPLVSAAEQSALLTSSNLRRDMLQTGKFGKRSTLMLSPVSSVFQLLNSQTDTDRGAALRWLVRNPPGEPGSFGTLAWQDIATKLNNATVARSMNTWLERVRQGQRATDLYSQMVRTLGIQSRAARHVAISCLRHFTGKTFGYDVNAPKLQRDAAASRWAAWISAR